MKRDEAYSQEVMGQHRPETRWFAKQRSTVSVTDITRPTTNPYYDAVHAKIQAKAVEPAKPSFFQKPFFIITFIMTGLGLILFGVSRLTGIKI